MPNKDDTKSKAVVSPQVGMSRSDHPHELKAKNASDLVFLRSETETGKERMKCSWLDGIRLEVREGSVCDMSCQVVVNAANETLEGGGGVDQAVHEAAGPQLLKECQSIPAVCVTQEGGAIPVGDFCRCPVGQVRVTKAYNIAEAEWIFHTVAPLLDRDGQPQPKLLQQCYRGCLEATKERNVESIAFCSLGTGFYGFPQVLAAKVAIAAVTDWISQDQRGRVSSTGSKLSRVVFSTWGADQTEIYERLLAQQSSGE